MLLVPIIAFLLISTSNLQRDVAVINANHWTSQDQAGFSFEVWQAIGARALESESPPQWFVDVVSEGKAERKEIKDLLETHLHTHNGNTAQ